MKFPVYLGLLHQSQATSPYRSAKFQRATDTNPTSIFSARPSPRNAINTKKRLHRSSITTVRLTPTTNQSYCTPRKSASRGLARSACCGTCKTFTCGRTWSAALGPWSSKPRKAQRPRTSGRGSPVRSPNQGSDPMVGDTNEPSGPAGTDCCPIKAWAI